MRKSWIKITDLHPRRSADKIAICIQNGSNNYFELGYYGAFFKDTEPCWWTENWNRISNSVDITHWQPIELPAPL